MHVHTPSLVPGYCIIYAKIVDDMDIMNSISRRLQALNSNVEKKNYSGQKIIEDITRISQKLRV